MPSSIPDREAQTPQLIHENYSADDILHMDTKLGTRVHHWHRGLGTVVEIMPDDPRNKPFMVQFDNGEIHMYSKESKAKLDSGAEECEGHASSFVWDPWRQLDVEVRPPEVQVTENISTETNEESKKWRWWERPKKWRWWEIAEEMQATQSDDEANSRRTDANGSERFGASSLDPSSTLDK